MGKRNKIVYFWGDRLTWINKKDRARRYASSCPLTALSGATGEVLYCAIKRPRRVGGPKFEFLWCLDAHTLLEEFYRGGPWGEPRLFPKHLSKRRAYLINLISEARSKVNGG